MISDLKKKKEHYYNDLGGCIELGF